MPHDILLPLEDEREDADLDNFFQRILVGLTGLPSHMVRPAWQEISTNDPDINENWICFCISLQKTKDFPYISNESNDTGDEIISVHSHEEMTILCSCYGPKSGRLAAMIRDGLAVSQNREALFESGMGLIDVGSIVNVPSIINTKLYNRRDLEINVRREVVRRYETKAIASLDLSIKTNGSTSYLEFSREDAQ